MSEPREKLSLNYQDAGVDIDAGNQFVENIKSLVKRTHSKAVMTGIGGFAALYDLSEHNCQQPVLVSATDGVGTKLKLAIELNQHQTIGIDLVAMCANDLICTGAKPLFFLDYYASGKLKPEQSIEIIRGIADGCSQAQMSLTGGETAEMPGMYAADDYDLAGFAVGIVDKSKIISPEKVSIGDVVIGLRSSGVHSNGFSLVRKILEQTQTSLQHPFAGSSIGDVLLEPTKIYVKSVQKLLASIDTHGIAHITGGGLLENLPRVLQSTQQITIDQNNIDAPLIFDWLLDKVSLSEQEAYQTFNMGVGLCLIVNADDAQHCLDLLEQLGETAFVLGTVETRVKHDSPQILLK